MHTHALRRATTHLHLVMALLFAVLVAACGGGGDSAPAAAPGSNVGPAGATVSSADGHASLTVPAGAVNTPITVTLAPASDGFAANPLLVPGSVYKLDVPDTTLAQPAELSITVPAAVAAAESRPRASAAGPGPSAYSKPVVCNADASGCWFVDFPGLGCNPPKQHDVNGKTVDYPVLLGYDSNFSSPDSLFAPGNPYKGPASYCARSTPPVPQIVSVGGGLAALVTLYNPATRIAKAQLGAIKNGFFGALLDTVAPTVKITATIVPGASNTATLKLAAVASDNLAVTKVTFEKVTGFQLLPVFQVYKSPIAQFVSGPYEWQSGPLATSEIYGKAYLACAFDAANNKTCDFVAPQLGAPVLTGFTAMPTTLLNGGAITLAWAASDATTLSIDQGVGDVSGQVNASANVSTTTTFTLTATNAIGSTTATTTVTVQPPAAPTISSFTAAPASLPTGGQNVTLNWATSGATGLSLSDGTVTTAVTGTSKVVNVTASTTFTLTASNAGGSTTAQTNVVVAASGDRFVDPVAGLDTNSCAQAAPCKTIAKAMTGAPAGSSVYLADGNYPSSNDATIPDGVALRATHPGAATLNFVSLTAAGSASVNGLVFDVQGQSCSSLTAAASTGTPTLALTGVLFKCAGVLNLGGSVKAVMTPGLLANGQYTALATAYTPLFNLSGSAELLIQGGIIDFNNFGQGAFGPGMFNTGGSNKLTLDAVTVRNLKQQAFVIGGSTSVTLRNGTLIDHVGDGGLCAAGAAIVVAEHGTLTMDHATVSNGLNSAICVTSSTTPLPTIQLTQSTISGMAGAAIASTTGTSADAQITADGLALINNGRGIIWTSSSAAGSLTLSNLTITGNTYGGMTVSNGALTLRGSTVSNNGAEGGVTLYGILNADLGTSASPGGNTFTGNIGPQINSVAAAGQTVNAVGNTWTPNVQGADANGRYSQPPAFAPAPKTGPTNGVNYQIYNASTLNL